MGKIISMIQNNDILVLPIDGDLDVTTVGHLHTYMNDRIDQGCNRVILNFADTNYVDTMGMSLIMSVARRLGQTNGQLSIVNVSDAVYRSLCIYRLVDLIPVKKKSCHPQIPTLDPGVRPLWQSTMKVSPERMAAVRQRMSDVLAHTALSPAEIFDFTLAGGEALGNAVDHTCAMGVLLTVSIYPDRAIVEVTDCGEGFELAADEEPPTASDGEFDACVLERGRGIRLMRMLADSVEIHRKPSGSGTVVQLVKMFMP